MLSSSLKRLFLPALVLVALPTAALAQQPQPATPPAGGIPQEVQGWLVELQQLHTRLETIQQKAMEDPALSAAQAELGRSIKAAMEKADPALEKNMARIQELETEAATAQQAGDAAKLQQLGAEAQGIQQQFMLAQQQAMQQPELAAKLQAFQSQLEKKMLEVDPEAKKLIARFQELEAKLSTAMQGGPGE